MLNKHGFDLWAEDYDKTVQLSEENNEYPFAGYKQILNTIFNEAMQIPKSEILDIGFGTAILTRRLYDEGHQITGIDFSTEMIQIAQGKMPDAHLLADDITQGLPVELEGKLYDSIISTYALHHLTDSEKVEFIAQLLSHLKDDGQLLIGDIAFVDRDHLNLCREKNRHHWDDDEFYFVIDELKVALDPVYHFEFQGISHCGGVINLKRL